MHPPHPLNCSNKEHNFKGSYEIRTLSTIPSYIFSNKSNKGHCIYIYDKSSHKDALTQCGKDLIQLYESTYFKETDGFCCYYERVIQGCGYGWETDSRRRPISRLNECYWMFKVSREEDLREKTVPNDARGTIMYGRCVYLLTRKTNTSRLYEFMCDAQNEYLEV